jgi:CBS domain containing-hemolysin-like protein
VRLPGDLPLDQARVWVEDAWPSEGESVGAFVRRTAGRLPEPGDELDVAGLHVEVESVENDRIGAIIVQTEDGKAEDPG